MNDVVFVSVAFGERYVQQQIRLKESILAIYPNANIMFWTNEMPPCAKSMDVSLYGFKVHAIYEARKKYSRVIWLDPAMILMDRVDDLLSNSVVAVNDDNKLYNLISDRACEYYRITKDEIKKRELHLVGGSLYYFDFKTSIAREVFIRWYTAEGSGIFGSQMEAASELINGHRNDETCMAMSLYYSSVEPIPGPDIRYCIENNPIFIKKHFK